jgi:16S rRNA (guanine1516-N2)-methyltransferase
MCTGKAVEIVAAIFLHLGACVGSLCLARMAYGRWYRCCAVLQIRCIAPLDLRRAVNADCLNHTMKLTSLVYLDAAMLATARQLAARFDVPCVDGTAVAAGKPKWLQRFVADLNPDAAEAFVFVLGADGLALYAVGPQYGVSIRADFHGPSVTFRRKQGGGKGQMIAKAVGVRGGVYPRVLDATAGLGGDGFVLASLGCQVTLLERVAAVRALLDDGLAQARRYALAQDADLLQVLERLSLVETDAAAYLPKLTEANRPDVVYLDPMFPVRSKSALVKKEMRVFHSLVGQDTDADGLLAAALSCARYRVVVKRPRLAPPLAGAAPNHVLEGKSNRYDLYTLEKLPSGLNA